MQIRRTITREQALQKLRHFCAYQERCHSEVRDKLYQLGMWKNDLEEIISTLIEENYLNEERFAIAYAGGRFRTKQWGKQKIRYELKKKQVSEYCIRKALLQIDEQDYLLLIAQLAEKKYNALKGDQYLVRKKKTQDYLVQKGFEPELVREAVNSLSQK